VQHNANTVVRQGLTACCSLTLPAPLAPSIPFCMFPCVRAVIARPDPTCIEVGLHIAVGSLVQVPGLRRCCLFAHRHHAAPPADCEGCTVAAGCSAGNLLYARCANNAACIAAGRGTAENACSVLTLHAFNGGLPTRAQHVSYSCQCIGWMHAQEHTNVVIGSYTCALPSKAVGIMSLLLRRFLWFAVDRSLDMPHSLPQDPHLSSTVCANCTP
jgi:hypothetical protein